MRVKIDVWEAGMRGKRGSVICIFITIVLDVRALSIFVFIFNISLYYISHGHQLAYSSFFNVFIKQFIKMPQGASKIE